MTTKTHMNWFHYLKLCFKAFIEDMKHKNVYEVIDVKEPDEQEQRKVVIRLEGHYVIEKTVEAVIMDDNLILGLGSQATRALTYLATLDKLSPEYRILSQELNSKVEEYILYVRHKRAGETKKYAVSKLSKDKHLINKFSPSDANRIGYMAGIQDTVEEFKLKEEINECH